MVIMENVHVLFFSANGEAGRPIGAGNRLAAALVGVPDAHPTPTASGVVVGTPKSD